MDFSTFSLSFFVIRLVLGLGMTGILIGGLLRPKTLGSYIFFVMMCSMPAIFAIGVAPHNRSACFLAGVAQMMLFIGGGLLFGKFEPENGTAEDRPANDASVQETKAK